jgi:hypothetical protein
MRRVVLGARRARCRTVPWPRGALRQHLSSSGGRGSRDSGAPFIQTRPSADSTFDLDADDTEEHIREFDAEMTTVFGPPLVGDEQREPTVPAPLRGARAGDDDRAVDPAHRLAAYEGVRRLVEQQMALRGGGGDDAAEAPTFRPLAPGRGAPVESRRGGVVGAENTARQGRDGSPLPPPPARRSPPALHFHYHVTTVGSRNDGVPSEVHLHFHQHVYFADGPSPSDEEGAFAESGSSGDAGWSRGEPERRV